MEAHGQELAAVNLSTPIETSDESWKFPLTKAMTTTYGGVSAAGMQVGKVEYLNCYDYYTHWWYPTYHHHYHPTMVQVEDKGQRAFAIVKSLQKKKLIQIKTVEQFVKIMDVVIDEL